MDCFILWDRSFWILDNSLDDEKFDRPTGAIWPRQFCGQTFDHVVQTKPFQRSSPNRYATAHTNNSKCTWKFQIIRKTNYTFPLFPGPTHFSSKTLIYCLAEPTRHREAEDDDNIAAQVYRLADRMDDMITAMNAKYTKRNYCCTIYIIFVRC